MGQRLRLAILGALATALLVIAAGCQRDGFACASDGDCFGDEVCESSTCVAQTTCTPETDDELCVAASACAETITVSDRCGTSREIFCPCSNNGNNVCVPESDVELCALAPAVCGEIVVTDSCDDTRRADCGMCAQDQTCVDNQCIGCDEPQCPATGILCGTARNSCGETVCGPACDGGDICVSNQCVPPVLAPDDLQPGDRFGERIRATNDYLVVGAPGTDLLDSPDAGAVWVYRRYGDEYVEQQLLTSPQPDADSGFGRIFDLLGGRLVVVDSFELVTFELDDDGQFQPVGTSMLFAPVSDVTLTEDDEVYVGYESSGSTPSLFPGSCGDDGCQMTMMGWVPEPGDPGNHGLGFALDSVGQFLFAGAPFDDINTTRDPEPAGSIYYFSTVFQSGWPSTEWSGGPGYFKVFSYLDVVGDGYAAGMGRSLSYSENGLAIIGAPLDSPSESFGEAGSLYLLGRTSVGNWTNQRRLPGPSDNLYARCGHAVVIAGEIAVASCVYDGQRDDPALDQLQISQTAGSVYTWTWQGNATWVLQLPTTLPNATEFDHFGWALEGTTDRFFAGAPGRSDDRGEVWVYPAN